MRSHFVALLMCLITSDCISQVDLTKNNCDRRCPARTNLGLTSLMEIPVLLYPRELPTGYTGCQLAWIVPSSAQREADRAAQLWLLIQLEQGTAVYVSAQLFTERLECRFDKSGVIQGHDRAECASRLRLIGKGWPLDGSIPLDIDKPPKDVAIVWPVNACFPEIREVVK